MNKLRIKIFKKKKTKRAAPPHLPQWFSKCFRLKAPVELNTGNHRQIRLLTGPLITASHRALNLCALRESAFQQSVISCYQGYFRWVTFVHSQHRNADDFPDSVHKPGRVILAQRELHIYLYPFVLLPQRKIVSFSCLEFYFVIYQSPPKKPKQKDKRFTSLSLL